MNLQKPEQSQSQGTGGKYLKLTDGQSVIGCFRGEIFSFKAKWNGKSYDPDPSGPTRYKCNFITKDDGKLIAKVFEFPGSVYETLYAINESLPLETQWIKISRKGMQKDTVWHVFPIGAVGGHLAEVAKVPLNTLGVAQKKEDVPIPEEPWSPEVEEPMPDKLPWED